MPMTPEQTIVLHMEGIVKDFPGVRALDRTARGSPPS